MGKISSPDEMSDRLLDFAVRVGKVVDALPDTNELLEIIGGAEALNH
jgi:hypothetical protein